MNYIVLVEVPELDMAIEQVCYEINEKLKGNIESTPINVRPLSEVIAC